eukprot:TRINITY_DN1023_c0_g1_i1.p1 TRINITY_DN1023_c0_g1~~TRINITY_DN1023_c0_g1_i1.p1  ORF type:complete len:115 (+),score=17.48 TRINITY_DN1023_c0_g1_i1:33-347(+)
MAWTSRPGQRKVPDLLLANPLHPSLLALPPALPFPPRKSNFASRSLHSALPFFSESCPELSKTGFHCVVVAAMRSRPPIFAFFTQGRLHAAREHHAMHAYNARN